MVTSTVNGALCGGGSIEGLQHTVYAPLLLVRRRAQPAGTPSDFEPAVEDASSVDDAPTPDAVAFAMDVVRARRASTAAAITSRSHRKVPVVENACRRRPAESRT